jgi:hypothetical protein
MYLSQPKDTFLNSSNTNTWGSFTCTYRPKFVLRIPREAFGQANGPFLLTFISSFLILQVRLNSIIITIIIVLDQKHLLSICSFRKLMCDRWPFFKQLC